MKRGDLYRVKKPGSGDPKKQRVFVIISRQTLIDSNYSTVNCAPVFTRYDGLSTQIPVGIEDGLKHDSSINCAQLVSLQKIMLTDYIGSLSKGLTAELDRALATAVGVIIDAQ